MSASTVSITANTAARRRPVLVGERKSGIELVTSDGVAPSAAGGGGGGEDDKVTSGGGIGKDLSHSIRGESVLERSRDMVQVKKALPNSTTVLPRRTARKGSSKPEKPRWQTIVSVFTKNFLLLLVLLGLLQMIRKLMLNPGPGANSSAVPLEISDFEARIAEVEAALKTTAATLKTTTKMMQVQVEVVDRKIENEIRDLTRDMAGKIEDKGKELMDELKKLQGRTDSLEKHLSELGGKEWLEKEDFDRFFDEFKKAKGLDHGAVDANLDEIRAFARDIVEKEIERHAADGMGRVDYALASGGAVIVKHSEPYIVGKRSSWSVLTHRNKVHSDAEKMLRPSFGEPGQCFPLQGSTGFVQIKLRTAIIPEAITVEHVAKSVAYDRSSAPKDCRVSGWLQGQDAIDQAFDVEKMFLLTEFTYYLEKSNVQTFSVLNSAATGLINMIRLDFTSNHGSPSHTCIYRVRVHGHEPNSVSILAMQS